MDCHPRAPCRIATQPSTHTRPSRGQGAATKESTRSDDHQGEDGRPPRIGRKTTHHPIEIEIASLPQWAPCLDRGFALDRSFPKQRTRPESATSVSPRIWHRPTEGGKRAGQETHHGRPPGNPARQVRVCPAWQPGLSTEHLPQQSLRRLHRRRCRHRSQTTAALSRTV